MFSQNTRKYKTLFWLSLGGLTLFRFWFNGHLLLTGDEAYHWEWSRHLAWGYYDHPPLVAFLIRSFTCWGGNTLRAVRGGALLLSMGSVILVYLLAKDLSGKEESGLLAGFLALLAPIFTIGATIITTDTPHAFFWLLTIYCFYRALFTPERQWWYLGGIALGLAFLSKFFAFFIPLGLLAFLITAPGQRHWLKKKEPYLSLLLALLIFSPFIYWNATHDWATFAFNLSARHKTPQLTFKYLGEYLGGQALALFPTLLVLYLYGLYISARRGFKQREEHYLFLFFTSAPLWLAFAAISLAQRVGLHWPIVSYFSGLVITALLFPQSKNWYRRLLKIGLGGAVLINLIIYTLCLNPTIIPWDLSYAGRPDKIKSNKLRELYGWEELGRRVSTSFKELSAQGPSFIFSGSYALSSQTAFYTPQNPMVYLLGKGSVHGANFRYWQDEDALIGQNALLVSKDGKHPEKYFPLFERVEAESPLEIYAENRLIRTFSLFRCYNYQGGRG